jgi:precorrin-2 C20-methyltransferase / precorrin-3B C17-methyltransferase
VIAYHAGTGKDSNARRTAAGLFPPGVIEEQLTHLVTTGATGHPGGYAGALADFYEECAARLAAHLDAGRDVVLLAEGDPLFYGSYMYMHDRLAPRYETEIVPAVSAFAAATAAAAGPLSRQDDILTVLPGTLPEPELARRLADTDAAVILKLGRTFPAVRRALAAAGRLDHALYVERVSMPSQRWLPVAEVDAATVPYFSLAALAPACRARHHPARSRSPCGVPSLALKRVQASVPSGLPLRAEPAVCVTAGGHHAAATRTDDMSGQPSPVG